MFYDANTIQLFEDTKDNREKIEKTFNIETFSIIENQLYRGWILIDEKVSKKKLLVIVGKFREPSDDKKVFVLLLSRKRNFVKKEAMFKFYADNIENVFFKENKIFVTFKDETEQFGWIEWENDKFSFKMFEDPDF
jgi:hypothetical protein